MNFSEESKIKAVFPAEEHTSGIRNNARILTK